MENQNLSPGIKEQILCATARLELALLEGSAEEASVQLNGLLRAVTLPPTELEALLLDSCYTLLRVCGQIPEAGPRLEMVYSALFSGLNFYDFALLGDIYRAIALLRETPTNPASAQALYQHGRQAGTDTLLCYLIRRDLLNLLTRSDAFLTQQALIRTLISDLESFSEADKRRAESVGGILSMPFPTVEAGV